MHQFQHQTITGYYERKKLQCFSISCCLFCVFFFPPVLSVGCSSTQSETSVDEKDKKANKQTKKKQKTKIKVCVFSVLETKALINGWLGPVWFKCYFESTASGLYSQQSYHDRRIKGNNDQQSSPSLPPFVSYSYLQIISTVNA